MPPDLVTAFRTTHGEDVSDVAVHRGPVADERASSLQAGAFTSNGEVFLPAKAGPLTDPAARALLAHELVHVVQQRRLGGALPDEHSAAGQQLEAQARAHEDWARHGGVGPAPQPAPMAHRHAATPMIHPRVQRSPLSSAPATTTPTTAPTTTTTTTPPTTDTDTGSSSGSATGSDATPLTGGVRLADTSWTQQHDPLNPRTAGELGGALASSFGGMVMDEWGIDSDALPGGGFDRDLRRDQLRGQLLDEINAERRRQGMDTLPELGAHELQLVEDQLDVERHAAAERGGSRAASTSGTSSTASTGSAGASGATDDGRIRDFDQLGGELALGMVDLLGGGMIDLTAEQENELRHRPATAATGTAAESAAGTSSAAADPAAEPELIDPQRLDLDELAARLYDRLRTRLRGELLIDRERAGLLSDFR